MSVDPKEYLKLYNQESKIEDANKVDEEVRSCVDALTEQAANLMLEKFKKNLPETLLWLRQSGYPLKEQRGKQALAALAELTTVLKPFSRR